MTEDFSFRAVTAHEKLWRRLWALTMSPGLSKTGERDWAWAGKHIRVRATIIVFLCLTTSREKKTLRRNILSIVIDERQTRIPTKSLYGYENQIALPSCLTANCNINVGYDLPLRSKPLNTNLTNSIEQNDIPPTHTDYISSTFNRLLCRIFHYWPMSSNRVALGGHKTNKCSCSHLHQSAIPPSI